VYVFPDLSKDGNTFKEWGMKAKDFEKRLPKTRFIFSDLLEQLAPEMDKQEGNDLADYLIKQDWRPFRKRNIQKPPQLKPETTKKEIKEVKKKEFHSYSEYLHELKFDNGMLMAFAQTKMGYPANWDCHAEYIDRQTKQIIPKIEKNPALLKLLKGFDMDLINNKNLR
jgi:hypothetical protein